MSTDPTDDQPPPEGEFIDRRSGKDRRSGRDRRRQGRRYRRLDVGDERRSGEDRRKYTRRSGVDRRVYNDARYKKPAVRKDAPPVYTLEDAARVQKTLSSVGYGFTCPVCGGSFTLGPVDWRGTESVRQVACAGCGRSTVVTNCLLARVMILTRIEATVKLVRGILTGVGHEVIAPAHAGTALELYRENPADVVIMDTFALEEMDGREFIRRLRREFSDPRVIVLAPRPSYRLGDPSAVAVQLGATHVLRMPFARDDLLRALKEARQ